MRRTSRRLWAVCGLLLVTDGVASAQSVDPRLIEVVSSAVAKAAMDSGVAKAPIEDFEEWVGKVLTPEEREEDIDTLAGLVFYIAGRVPGRGEVVRHSSGIEFEITDADPRRIRRMRICNLPAMSAAE